MPKKAQVSLRGRTGYPRTDGMTEHELTFWSILYSDSILLDRRMEKLPHRVIQHLLARNTHKQECIFRAKSYVKRLLKVVIAVCVRKII